MTTHRHGPFAAPHPLVLASGSPRRRELLADLGIAFDVHPATLAEPVPLPGEPAGDYALRMAGLKTRDVAARFPDRVVLGADTIVVLDGAIMGKPRNATDALAMLTRLSGRTHQVVTAFCVIRPGGEAVAQCVSTDVDMRVSGQAELRSYVATGEPMDKAGAYAIQGIGTFLVTAIRGSYTNVVGLPLARVLEVLLAWGALIPGQD